MKYKVGDKVKAYAKRYAQFGLNGIFYGEITKVNTSIYTVKTNTEYKNIHFLENEIISKVNNIPKFKYKDKVIINGKGFNREYNNVKGVILADEENLISTRKTVYIVGLETFEKHRVPEQIIDFLPQTNRQWLESLSNEELANYLIYAKFNECNKEEFIEWLQAEHKE